MKMDMDLDKAVWFGVAEPTAAEREGARLRGDEICAIPEGMALASEDVSSPAACKRVVEALRVLAQREGAVAFYGVFPIPMLKFSWDIVSQAVVSRDGFPGKKGLLASVYASNGEFLRWEVVGAI